MQRDSSVNVGIGITDEARSHTVQWAGAYLLPMVLEGASIRFIDSEAESTVIHQNPHLFNHDAFLLQLVRKFGVSKQGARNLWMCKHVSLRTPSLGHNILSITRRKLAALGRADGIPHSILNSVEEFAAWDRMSQRSILKDSEQTRLVSLGDWIQDVFAQASTKAFFGDAIFRLNPNLVEDFRMFDDRAWMLIFNIPRPWSQKMKTGLNRTLTAIEAYLQLPEAERKDGSLLFKDIEAVFHEDGDYQHRDIAGILLMIYWG